MSLRISVVVPTYKRPELLERCLKGLLTQKFAPDEFEIIIVDDAASDTTKKQVENWARQAQETGHTIHYVPVTGSRHGPAVARNCGWHTAQADILAFTDDDCIPEMHWLQMGVKAFTDDIAAISGRIVVPLPSVPTDYEYNSAQIQHSEFATANCFYRRSVLTQVGGFDEHFTIAWREDSDLFFTLQSQHFICIFAPEAVVMHPVRAAGWGVSLQQQRKSMFNALLYKKHPDLYRRHIQAAPPWRYYGIVGCLLLILLGLFVHIGFLAIVALLAWLYMTGRFCIQRLRKTSRAPGHILEMIITSALIPPLAVFWRLWGAIRFRVPFL
jgi:cellulose synthase/poly-beta-1,6-N-acetylglucosamine synthase-like glycosyltransferase